MKSELVYGGNGSLTGVRHYWMSDDMFSAFATDGVQGEEKGRFRREKMASLAKVNVESLKEHSYFS
jgi:ABC-type uncharacterized transport system substrate-binding protein